MKIVSWNVNGIRAVYNKGALDDFIQNHKPDAIFFQEIKASIEKIPKELLKYKSYECFYHPAERPGYSGVAVWVKSKDKNKIIKKGMKGFTDKEGRVLSVDIDKNITLVSVYVPNGGKSEEAYKEKLKFYKLLTAHIKTLEKNKKTVILGGDFNCAEKEIDLAQPERHLNNVCFREDIRKEFEVFRKNKFIDVFRHFYPDKKDSYTYWDNFDFSLPKGKKPREINRGWRLDYFFVSEKNIKKVSSVEILDKVMGSDHCPVMITLK